MIPIVAGAHPDDYKKVAPLNSYIHVEDFLSPQQLANYLNLLNENDSLYNNYFQWKGTGEFINTYFFCRLCSMLNSNPPRKNYKDLDKWRSSKSACTEKFWLHSLQKGKMI